MKIAGIVAEYNPFHNGHKYHLEKTKELTGADRIVVVMSGNYVQRGETAIISKWARAEAAVENGADLVVELPAMWSVARAQDYACGAVSLLNSLGCIDVISFGSECGNAELLIKTAQALGDAKVTGKMRKDLETGISFASARAEAVRTYYGDECYDILNEPNNNLGIEYILANSKYEKRAEICTVKRKGASHDGIIISGDIASASEIRKMMINGECWENYVPKSAAEIYKREIKNHKAPALYSKLELSILCCMRRLSAEEIAKTPDVSEGIENRIHDAALKAKNLDELFSLAKTKRYSHARIRRIVLASFLGFTREICCGSPPYIKILAMNGKGREILRAAKENAALPIVTKAADIEKLSQRAGQIYSLESECTDIYSLTAPEILPCGREQTAQIIIR